MQYDFALSTNFAICASSGNRNRVSTLGRSHSTTKLYSHLSIEDAEKTGPKSFLRTA